MIVDVITRHAPSNYGSLLQSIATVKVLQHLGHRASIVDYIRPDDLGLNKVKQEAFLKGGSAIKRLIYILIRFPIEKIAEVRFAKMRKKHLSTTPRCSSIEELGNLQADCFMTGSDQVWGPMVNGEYDPAYFLDFVKDGKKVAYAASVGKTNFDEKTISDYKRHLSTYDKIAVREDSAVDLIKGWGATNCVGQVIDPTLLLSGDEWKNLLYVKDSKTGPYILIYQIHNDPKLSQYAKDLAALKKLKLIRVNPFLHQCFRGGSFRLCPDVKDFLELINNAAYIVTDSFHGTCFAINFNKQFVEILPNNATGTRNQSILTLTGLSSRIVTNFEDFTVVDNEIDYGPVNKILEEERERCKDVLKKMLQCERSD